MTRRVVTGVNGDGRAVFVSDEVVEPTRMSNWPEGTGIAKLWGSNTRPIVPNDGSSFEYDSEFPPPGGFRLKVLRLWPQSAGPTPLDPDQAAAEFASNFPGFFDHMESGEGGMHSTQTVDFVVVLDGEISLELDDREVRVLRAGDVAVLNGVTHTWLNQTNSICTFLAVSIGADRKS